MNICIKGTYEKVLADQKDKVYQIPPLRHPNTRLTERGLHKTRARPTALQRIRRIESARGDCSVYSKGRGRRRLSVSGHEDRLRGT